MIKSELVHRISDQKPQLHGREVEKVVNTILDEIAAALVRGDRAAWVRCIRDQVQAGTQRQKSAQRLDSISA